MKSTSTEPSKDALLLSPVTSENWRGVAGLEVNNAQRDFVAEPSYYLALCCYGDSGWRPLAVQVGEQVIGFLMWAVDPDDSSCWLGGIIVDRDFQGRGYGKRLMQRVISMLAAEHGHRKFALSYQPSNLAAKRLYAGLGFVETGEREGDEVVARLSVDK